MTDNVQMTEVETEEGQEPEAAVTEPVETFDRAYVEKLRKEAAENRVKLNEIERERKEAEEQRLIEQKKYQELYETAQSRVAELEPYEQRIQALTDAAKAANEKRIEALPDTMKTLVPEYDDPFKLQNWLETNSAIFAKTDIPDLDGGKGNGSRKQTGTPAPTEAEIREQAARLNVNPKHLAAQYGVQLQRG